MSCYRPLKGFLTAAGVVFSQLRRHGDIIRSIEVPCGQCIGCRARRASDWSLRVMHEASLWPENSFLTLTYGRDSLPPNGDLCHRDVQLFFKRLRKELGKPIRYFMCGEYGPVNMRPHYHVCLFNEGFLDDRIPAGKSSSGHLFYESVRLNKFWKHGRAVVQNLTSETSLYCAKYVISKLNGKAASVYEYVDADGVVCSRRPPYAAMSLKPGIGAKWLEKYFDDVYRHDYAVQDGVKKRPPKYYDKLAKKRASFDSDLLEFKRLELARLSAVDNTEERRAVREYVHLSKSTVFTRKEL